MADETYRFFKELAESSLSHSINTMTSDDDWMTEMEEEDKVSLPLSDEDVLSFKPWERNERKLILQNYKDTSIFSSNIDSSTEISEPIQNYDIFSMMKNEHTSITNVREDEDVGLGNPNEVLASLSHGEESGEKFCQHDSCRVGHCLDARPEHTSSFNFYEDISQKSEMLSSHNNHHRFMSRENFNDLIGISDKKLRGYLGVEGLNLKKTVLDLDRHGCEECSKEERVNKMNELSHIPNFLFTAKSRKLDDSIITFSDKREEKLPSFWWLSTNSRYTNKNDNNNSTMKNLDLKMESLSKHSSGKLEKIKGLSEEKSQPVNQSQNLTSNEHTFIQADSPSAQFFVTSSNSYSCVKDHHKSLNENAFGSGKAWWKDVKRVNLPDFPYGFTQKKIEVTMKNIHGNSSKINCTSNRKEKYSGIFTKKPDCEFLESKLSVTYDKDENKGEMDSHIILEEAQKNTNDISQMSDEFLNKSILSTSLKENRTNMKLEINQTRETVEQNGGNQSKTKDLHLNFNKRPRLENQFPCDIMSILKVQENENYEREQKVINDSKLEGCDFTFRMSGVNSEECNTSHRDEKFSEKCKGYVGNDFSQKILAHNEHDGVSNQLENAEFSAEYDSMLVLEAIKIETEVINKNNGENILENSAKTMIDYSGNSCEGIHDFLKISDHSKKTVAEIQTEDNKEVTHIMDDFIVIADQIEVKEIESKFPTCREIKETEKSLVDKYCVDQLKGLDNNYDSSIDIFDKNNTLVAKEKDFKTKFKNIFEKDQKFLDKDIPGEQKRKNEVDDSEENHLNKTSFENSVKVGYDSRVSREELLEGSIEGTKIRHQRVDECDYLLEKYLCSLNREEQLEKEIGKSQFMNEVSLKSEVAKQQVIIPKEKVHASELYEEKPKAFMECPKNPDNFQSKCNREMKLEINCENELDIQESLLSEEKDHDLNQKKMLETSNADLNSEDMAYFNNQDLTNEDLKNLSSSLVLKDILNYTNSGSLSSVQDQKTVEEFSASMNPSSFAESPSSVKPVYCDSTETIYLKLGPDLNHCLIDDDSEKLCWKMQNHTDVAKENDFYRNELLCRTSNYLPDKESNDWLVNMIGCLKDCIRSKDHIQDKKEFSNAPVKIASQTLSSSTRGWNSIPIRNVMNMSFVRIQFQNISMHEATATLLKNFICSIKKENINNLYLNGDNQNVGTRFESGRIAHEDCDLNLKLHHPPMSDANKSSKSLNELVPCNISKVMELTYQRDLVGDCKVDKTSETNNIGNCKVIEKGLLDVGELYNNFLAELYIYSKPDDHCDVMLENLCLITNESLIEINLGVDQYLSNKETQYRKSDKELPNSSFEIDIRNKELDKCAQNADESNYIPFHQEYIDSKGIFDKEDLEKIIISKNKKFHYLSNLNITDSLTSMVDQGYPLDDESLYNFNPWVEASVAKESQEISMEEDTGHSKSLGNPSLIETDDEDSLLEDEEKLEDTQSTDDSLSYTECFGIHSETGNEALCALGKENYEDSSLSIKNGEGMSEEDILNCKTNVNMEDYDDTSLDSYLSAIIEKHFKSEEQTHVLQCSNPENKTLAAVNAECQTKISGFLDTFHFRTCVDHFILSANEDKICYTNGNRRSIDALNLEISKNKRLKCMDADDYYSMYNKEHEGNTSKKRTSCELDISVGEEKDSPIKKTKLDETKQSIDKVLQLEEDEWSEITNDRIASRESLDQKVPDVTTMITYQGMKEEDSKPYSRKILCEENDSNIREVPSVPKISQRTSVLRLGLSKRARPRPLHKVQ